MANTRYQSVDEYIALQPAPVRPILEKVRSIIHKSVPQAVEVISYQIPTFKLHGAPLLYFAGWKQHYSLYPAIGGLQEAFAKELAQYEVSKGTIRFPLSEPVPAKLIERIAKFRAQKISGSAKAPSSKAAAKRQ